MLKLKKYTIAMFSIFALIVGLHLSIKYEGTGCIRDLFSNVVFAADSTTTTKKETEKKESSISTNKENTGSDMVDLLARLINGEARGEPYEGQVAVGAVVLNRVKSPEFPNTIPGVIYQKGQFTCVTDGQFDKPIEKGSTVYQAAKEALSGSDPSNGSLYFFDPKHTKSKWLFSLKVVTTIGGHRFCLEE